jgi:hypothetical protein
VRRFTCGTCGNEVSFTSSECEKCGTALGFLMPAGTIVPLKESGTASYTISPGSLVDDDQGVLWRCLNFAWGCNWMLRAESGAVWCESCRLTRGRPDEASIDAVLAWSGAEQAKRRLVYQLHALGLPIGRPPGTSSISPIARESLDIAPAWSHLICARSMTVSASPPE